MALDPELLNYCHSDRQREILQAIIDEGGLRPAARRLDTVYSNVARVTRAVRQRAARQGYSPDHDMIRTVPDGFRLRGTSTLYDQDGALKQQWVKSEADKEQEAELQRQFAETLSEHVRGKAKPIKRPKTAPVADLMSCYVIGDAHIGLRAWRQETGVENFDTEIATSDIRGAVDHLVASAPDSEVGVFVNVGDFLHANDTTSQTPLSKNLLDTDGRFGDVIDHAVNVIVYSIDRMLAKHRKVQVVNARGNHDPDAALWLNKLIAAYYSREPRVEVVPNDSRFIYMRWGKTLIGVHHGDRIKRQQIYEAMTRDRRKDWGECEKVYFWTGHIHHKNAEEIGGCLFESFNTLAAPDSWHAGAGYGAGREMQCLIMSKEYGLLARNVCAIEMARAA